MHGSLTQYLTTTYALTDEGIRRALERFLGHPETGIFQGPYLRIRTPSMWPTVAGSGSWSGPTGSQLRPLPAPGPGVGAAVHTARPTLVTTGTGSGKTESFLNPVLDHCRREPARGNRGVKAVLLYPMNALATDQAGRIGDYLTRPELAQVTAGLYIGDRPDRTFAG